MKKILFLLCILGCSAQAQSWAPYGATWTYEYINNSSIGSPIGTQGISWMRRPGLPVHTCALLVRVGEQYTEVN